MLSLEKFRAVLKSKGLKATPQRLAVHKAMLEMTHACAEQVAAHIQAGGEVKISVASVYNTLNQLSAMGIYHCRFSADSKLHFDINTHRHVHLYDKVNHEFKDIADEDAITEVESYFRGRRFRGFKVDEVDIQLICHPTKRKLNR